MSEILTAQTDGGRAAVEQVMKYSYQTDISDMPAQWVRVLVDEGDPVSYVAIDPNREIEYPRGTVRYGFVRDAGTRLGRRGQGHFRRLLEASFDDLTAAGIAWVFGRVPYGLGRTLGFHVFSQYSTLLVRPEEIEQTLGGGRTEGAEAMLTIEEIPDMREDVLLVSDVRAPTEVDAVLALREAAWIARSNGKVRIVFEHPRASMPGSRYRLVPERQTVFLTIAMTCGARVRVQGSERAKDEGSYAGPVDETPADMVRVLDLPQALREVLAVVGTAGQSCPQGAVAFDTDIGQATIHVDATGVRIEPGMTPGAVSVALPAEAVAQIIVGYRSLSTQAYIYQTEVPQEAVDVVDHLFPRLWRLTRDHERLFGKTK